MNPLIAYAGPLAVAEVLDILTGQGRHADHRQRQAGQKVECSCGVAVTGMLSGADHVRPAVRQGILSTKPYLHSLPPARRTQRRPYPKRPPAPPADPERAE